MGKDGEGGKWCESVEVRVWNEVEFGEEKGGGGRREALGVGLRVSRFCFCFCFCFCC